MPNTPQMTNINLITHVAYCFIVLFSKIQFYRPFTENTDPIVPKGLYYSPRSVNTDPLGNPDDVTIVLMQHGNILKYPDRCLIFINPRIILLIKSCVSCCESSSA